MAYGKSNAELLLKEGAWEIGTWTAPNALVPGTDPRLSFASSGDLGFFQQGTLAPEINRTYATPIAGTPGKKIRKDLTLKEFMMTATFYQFNEDLLALAQGLDVDSGTYSIAWIGNDEPSQTFNGYLLTTERVDAKPFLIALWYGKVTSEAVGPTFPGTEHSTYEFKVESFEHPAFVAAPDDTHNYGAMIIDNS